MKILPITKIILQAEGKYYSIPFDATAGIHISPGEGSGLLTHNGIDYLIVAKDTSATVAVDTSQDAPYERDEP